jgi:hypothetical protein
MFSGAKLILEPFFREITRGRRAIVAQVTRLMAN